MRRGAGPLRSDGLKRTYSPVQWQTYAKVYMKFGPYLYIFLQVVLKFPYIRKTLLTTFVVVAVWSTETCSIVKGLTRVYRETTLFVCVCVYIYYIYIHKGNTPVLNLYAKSRIASCAVFLGAFAKLRKGTISSVVSVCPSAWNISSPTGRIFVKFYI
jgi:hypothetical protein